jgi:5-hydroxyisourate hydrolase
MISTHILDTSKGMPAANVVVSLEQKENHVWKLIGTGSTNTDGRFVFDCPKVPGDYRLNFGIEDYYKKDGDNDFFFLDTPVVFKITNTERKYHVPLLLNPYGYTTYRGS